ncbi:MAG: hypothetical protein AAFP88_01705 [Bacteroidota bacterium]
MIVRGMKLIEKLKRANQLFLNLFEAARFVGGNIDIAYQKMNVVAGRKQMLV